MGYVYTMMSSEVNLVLHYHSAGPFFVASSVIELGVSSKAAMIRKVPRQSVQPSPQQ